MLAGLLAACWWFFAYLPAPPATGDAVSWVGRGSPFAAEWPAWVLRGPHYVGYRPVMAASFVPNGIFGLVPVAYRLVDLSLWAGAGLLTFALARRRSGGLAAWVAVAFYAVHPLSEEILLDLARRSYPLSMALVLSGWGVLKRRPGLGAVLMALAVATNETAVVPALVLSLDGGGGLRARLRRAGPTWLAVGAWAVVRTVVVGGLGGYTNRKVLLPWVAGVRKARGGDAWRSIAAGLAEIHTILLPGDGDRGLSTLGTTDAGLAVGVAAGAWLLWRGARRGDGLLIAWMTGACVLAGWSQSYYWRMSYALLPPFALLLGRLIATDRSWLTRGAAALLVVNLLPESPVLVGRRDFLDEQIARGGLLDVVEEHILEHPGCRVIVDLPYSERMTRVSARWLDARLPDHLVSSVDDLRGDDFIQDGTLFVHTESGEARSYVAE